MDLTKEEILSYLKEIKPNFEAKGIKELALFGSFAKQKQTSFSDIDIIVSLQSNYLQKHDSWSYFELLEECKTTIANHFHKSVDIFDTDSASAYKNTILNDAIYA